jgi:hypothetical protein
MANGLLAPMPNVAQPQQAANDTLQQMQMQKANAQGLLVPGQGGMQQAQQYMNPESISQLYGILAQGATDPQQLGAQYISAMQAQQRSDPLQNVMQLFGKINPHDYSPQSIQKFYNHLMQTGEPRYDFLAERERLSSTEEKALLDSYNEMTSASSALANIGNLAERFQGAIGEYRQGLYGTLDSWYKKSISGDQDDLDLLKQQYIQLRNEQVIKNLPPGVASDRDIAIAQEGWPPPNANAEYIASFLRGVQKMQVIKYASAMHRNNYISANQNMRFMGQDWGSKADLYTLESMRANGLEPNLIDTDETPQQYARRMLRGGTTDRVGGQPDLIPSGGFVEFEGKRLDQMDFEERDAARDKMLDQMLGKD